MTSNLQLSLKDLNKENRCSMMAPFLSPSSCLFSPKFGGKNYDDGASALYWAIEKKIWNEVLAILQHDPSEAATWIFRHEKDSWDIRWRLLPIHAAIIFKAPEGVVEALLTAFPEGALSKEDQGMIPLHLAFRHGASDATLYSLVNACPASIAVTDRKGRVPIELHRTVFVPDPKYLTSSKIVSGLRTYVSMALQKERDALMSKLTAEFNTKLKEANGEFEEKHDSTVNDYEEKIAAIQKEMVEKVQLASKDYEAKISVLQETIKPRDITEHLAEEPKSKFENFEEYLNDEISYHSQDVSEIQSSLTETTDESLNKNTLAQLHSDYSMQIANLEEWLELKDGVVHNLEESNLFLEDSNNMLTAAVSKLTAEFDAKLKEANAEHEIKYESAVKTYEDKIAAIQKEMDEKVQLASKDYKAARLVLQTNMKPHDITESLAGELKSKVDNLEEYINDEISYSNQDAEDIQTWLTETTEESINNDTLAQLHSDFSMQITNLEECLELKDSIVHSLEESNLFLEDSNNMLTAAVSKLAAEFDAKLKDANTKNDNKIESTVKDYEDKIAEIQKEMDEKIASKDNEAPRLVLQDKIDAARLALQKKIYAELEDHSHLTGCDQADSSRSETKRLAEMAYIALVQVLTENVAEEDMDEVSSADNRAVVELPTTLTNEAVIINDTLTHLHSNYSMQVNNLEEWLVLKERRVQEVEERHLLLEESNKKIAAVVFELETQIHHFQSTIHAKTQQITSLQDHNALVESLFQTATLKIDKQATDIQHATREKEVLETTTVALKARIEELENYSSEYQKSFVLFKQRIDELEAQLQGAISEHETQIHYFESLIQAEGQQVSFLLEHNDLLESLFQTATLKIDKQATNLRNAISEKEILETTTVELMKRIKALVLSNSEYQDAFFGTTAAAELRASLTELQVLKDVYQALEISDQADQTTDLTHQKVTMLKNLKLIVDELELPKADCKSVLKAAIDQSNKILDEKDLLERDAEGLQKMIESLQGSNKTLTVDLDEAMQNIHELEIQVAEYNELQNHVKEFKMTADKMQGSSEEHQSLLKSANKTILKQESKKHVLHSEREDATSMYQIKSSSVDAYKVKLDAATVLLAEQVDEINRMKSTAEILISSYESKYAAESVLEEKLTNTENEVADFREFVVCENTASDNEIAEPVMILIAIIITLALYKLLQTMESQSS